MKKLLIVFLIIVALAVLAAGGLLVYRGKNIPVINKVVTIPWVEKNPSVVLAGLFDEGKQVTTAHMLMDLNITAKSNTVEQGSNSNSSISGLDFNLIPGDITLAMTLNSDFKLTDQEESPSQFSLAMQFGFGGASYEIGLESVYKDEVTYIRATKLPAIPFFDLSPYQNQWYSYQMKDFIADFNEIQGQAIANQNANITPAQIETLKNIFQNNKFVTVKQRLPDEIIDGENCYHYALAINKDNFKTFVRDIYGILADLAATAKESDMESLMSQIDIFADGFNAGQTEIYIGQNDGYPHKLSFIGKFGQAEEGQSVFETLDVSLGLTLSKINEDYAVEVPVQFKTLDSLWEDLTDNSDLNLNLNTNQAQDDSEIVSLAIDSDNDGLTDMEEIIYGTDKNNPDTDGDGHLDGAEVENGYNPNGVGKLDSDNDGLSDADEERYGTDKNNPDTDGDGHQDGTEVLNGYNPLGPGKLLSL
ncbi:MAG: hypothetical protein ABIH38_00650 [Patescibacteria group bacterium]